MPYRTCDHLKEDGLFCSSPALRDQRYCYFHLNARARRVQSELGKLRGEPFQLQMPILDNMQSVLAGIQQVLDALAAHHIKSREAACFLYGLQQAAAALKSDPKSKGSRPELPADEPLSVLDVGTLYERYRLPFDTNLDIPPFDAAAEIQATAGLHMDLRVANVKLPYMPRVPARPTAADSPAPPTDSYQGAASAAPKTIENTSGLQPLPSAGALGCSNEAA